MQGVSFREDIKELVAPHPSHPSRWLIYSCAPCHWSTGVSPYLNANESAGGIRSY